MRRSRLGIRAGSGLGDFSGGGNCLSLDSQCLVELLRQCGGVSYMVSGCRSE